MAVLSEVVFLAALLMSGVRPLSYVKTEVRLGLAGEEATFPILPDLPVTPASYMYEGYLYRKTQNGTILLKNSSAPSQFNGMEESDRVSCFFTARDTPYAFVLRNLSLSDSGEYLTEVWADGMHRHWMQFNLIVCAGPVAAEREEHEDSIEWTLRNVSTGEGETVQLYAQNLLNPSCPSQSIRNKLVLDTAQSLKSLVSELGAEVRPLSNGTLLRVSVPSLGSRVCGHILVKRGEECRLYSERRCTFLFGRTPAYVHFLRAGDGFVLACHPQPRAAYSPIQWSTARGSRATRIPAAPANLSYEEAEAGMSNVSVRNDSLMVAIATPGHSGWYCCTPDTRPQARTLHWLFVCSQISAMHLMFVWDDSVELQCHAETETETEAEINSTSVVQWYRQRGPELEELLVEVDYFSTGRVQEDLGGRVSFSRFSLTISGFRDSDNGEYICRLWEGLNRRNASCSERRIRVVKRDFYKVYASLLGSGLLGMICAVVFFSVHFRGPDLGRAGKE